MAVGIDNHAYATWHRRASDSRDICVSLSSLPADPGRIGLGNDTFVANIDVVIARSFATGKGLESITSPHYGGTIGEIAESASNWCRGCVVYDAPSATGKGSWKPLPNAISRLLLPC